MSPWGTLEARPNKRYNTFYYSLSWLYIPYCNVRATSLVNISKYRGWVAAINWCPPKWRFRCRGRAKLTVSQVALLSTAGGSVLSFLHFCLRIMVHGEEASNVNTILQEPLILHDSVIQLKSKINIGGQTIFCPRNESKSLKMDLLDQQPQHNMSIA